MSETPCPFCGQIHINAMSECADGFTSRHECVRLTVNIEHLEDLLNGYRSLYSDMCDEYASLKAERDALLAGMAILMSEAQQGARFVHFEFFDGSSNTYPIDVILPPTTTPRG